MRRGGRILVVLGLLLGLATAAVTFFALSTNVVTGQKVETRNVVIAQQNIGLKTEIQAAQLGVAPWPVENIPPGGSFEKVEDVAGQIALTPIYPGQIILPQMIIKKDAAKETKTYASLLVPEGMVAIAFNVTPQSGVAGAVQPGDTVDMLLTLSPTQPTTPTVGTRPTTTLTGFEGLPVSQLFLQNVLVMHVGSWPIAGAQQEQATGGIVTFALNHQDALTLKSATEQSGGQAGIWLALRRAGDSRTYTTEGVTLQYLNKRFNFNLVPAVR